MRRSDAYKRDRRARIAEAKVQHEYSELMDCTFTPAITRKVPQATGPIIVRGLERYMELQVCLLISLIVASDAHSLDCQD